MKNFYCSFNMVLPVGGLRKAIYKEFCLGVPQREMIVLGLIGRKYYVTPENQTIDVVGAIEMIKAVNAQINEQAFDAESILDQQTDFFNETYMEIQHWQNGSIVVIQILIDLL